MITSTAEAENSLTFVHILKGDTPWQGGVSVFRTWHGKKRRKSVALLALL
jgi:hypothetical protein